MSNISSSVHSDCDTTTDSFDDNDATQYEYDEEVDVTISPVVFTPVPNQALSSSKPIQLEKNTDNQEKSTTLPLCVALNGQSLYNKPNNFKICWSKYALIFQ